MSRRFDAWYADTLRGYRPEAPPNEGFAPSLTLESMFVDSTAGQLASALRNAFAFLRRNDDRRYSSRSKLRVLETADALESEGFERGSGPAVILATTPFEYDEDTEVKKGGLIGALVEFDDGRTLVAVHPEARRKFVGSAMLRLAESYVMPPQLWAHRDNAAGMAFAVASGYKPFRFNQSGAVLFAQSEPRLDEETDAVSRCDDMELDALVNEHQRRAARARRRRGRDIPPLAFQRVVEPGAVDPPPAPPTRRPGESERSWSYRLRRYEEVMRLQRAQMAEMRRPVFTPSNAIEPDDPFADVPEDY